MKRILLITAIIPLLFIPVFAQELESIDDNLIPEWIKPTAAWWSEGKITDSEYLEGLKYLIEDGIIPIDTVQVNQITLSDETERLYQLEINQKEDKINILENEVESVGLDNSHLLQSIVEKDRIIADNEKTIGSLTRHMEIVNDSDVKKIEAAKLELEERYRRTITELQSTIKEHKDNNKIQEYRRLIAELVKSNNELEKLNIELSNKVNKLSFINNEGKTYKQINEEITNMNADLTTQLMEKTNALQLLQVRFDESQQKISELEQKTIELEQKISELEADLEEPSN